MTHPPVPKDVPGKSPRPAAARILVATDAWLPQTNGVVNTYLRIRERAAAFGFEIGFVTPGEFRTVPMPTYPEIRLALATRRAVEQHIEAFSPDYIHLATEGPIGLAARAYCRRAGRPFTTSYHTRFPEYLSSRFPVPLSWGYALQRWFHNAGAGMMVVTPSLASDLAARGFRNIYPWSRGIDLELFRPRGIRLFGDEKIFLYVGRVAVEKNIEAFLNINVPGKKVVVGGGPQLDELRRTYRDIVFTGPKYGAELADHFASADVFVFPSLTDTFGNVMLEALASGVPVAAYPVTGPKDLLDAETGVMDTDLAAAAKAALDLDREKCRAHASKFSWENCVRQFLDNVVAACGRAPLSNRSVE
jgi:glycosyltransferase involved in cell wall biosynthesis